jgi:hypothetical protein
MKSITVTAIFVLGCLVATSGASDDPFAVLGPFRTVPYKFYKTVIEKANAEIRRLLVQDGNVTATDIESMVGIIEPVDDVNFVSSVVKEIGLPFKVSKQGATDSSLKH